MQRELEKIFASIGAQIYSTAELCELVYPRAKWIQKKHRVAVLRALEGAFKRYPWIGAFRGARGVYVCDCRDLHAYALTHWRYSSDQTHAQAEERLAYDLKHPEYFTTKAMKPETGLWWLYCETAKAQWSRPRDPARALELRARHAEVKKKLREEAQAMIAILRSKLG